MYCTLIKLLQRFKASDKLNEASLKKKGREMFCVINFMLL